MTTANEVFDVFDDLGYMIEDSEVLDRICGLCDEYAVDENKMSYEYLTFASEKNYKEPTLDILEEFESEVWLGLKKIVKQKDPEHNQDPFSEESEHLDNENIRDGDKSKEKTEEYPSQTFLKPKAKYSLKIICAEMNVPKEYI